MSTLKDIAKYTGLSISTVSYALNGKGSISKKTIELVAEAAKKLKYDPNRMARRLKTGVSNLIGVIVNLDNLVNYSNKILNTINTLSNKQGYRLIVVHSENFTKDIAFMCENKVDGIIYLATNYIDSSIFSEFDEIECKIPIVFINCWHKKYSDSCILYDEERAIFELTSSLAREGHSSIGCITGENQWRATILRLNGFKRALTAFNIDENLDRIFYGSYFIAKQDIVERQAKELISRKVTAIVCFNDIIASTLYKIASQEHLIIPRDLSVTGFDNQLFASMISPKLTSVEIPVDGLSSSAFSLLLSKMHSETLSINTVIPCSIIKRESSTRN